MKTMGKSLVIVVMSVSLFAAGAGISATESAAPQIKAEKQLDNRVLNLLFVISSAQAKFKKITEKEFELVIPHKDLKSVLAFSSPPEHISFQMKPKAYVKMVYSGTNSFKQDPPNVSLQWAGQSTKEAAYTLTKRRVTQNEVIYTLVPIGPGGIKAEEKNGAITLFVDARGCKTIMNVLKCMGGGAASRIEGMSCRSYVGLPTCHPAAPPQGACQSPFGYMACSQGQNSWKGVPCRDYKRLPICH